MPYGRRANYYQCERKTGAQLPKSSQKVKQIVRMLHYFKTLEWLRFRWLPAFLASRNCLYSNAARQRRLKILVLSWTKIPKSSISIRNRKISNPGLIHVLNTVVGIVGITHVFHFCALARNSSSRIRCC